MLILLIQVKIHHMTFPDIIPPFLYSLKKETIDRKTKNDLPELI